MSERQRATQDQAERQRATQDQAERQRATQDQAESASDPATRQLERGELARRIHERSHLVGRFTLRSGATSTEYFDKYLFESDPALLWPIAEALAELVPSGTDALAGLELGGVPLATALSRVLGLPALFVRKEAKPHGTARLAEGGEVAGRRLTVVEDVVTSGGQVVASVGDLRHLGAEITTAVCVIDREAGGSEALAAEGIGLAALYRMGELIAAGG